MAEKKKRLPAKVKKITSKSLSKRTKDRSVKTIPANFKNLVENLPIPNEFKEKILKDLRNDTSGSMGLIQVSASKEHLSTKSTSLPDSGEMRGYQSIEINFPERIMQTYEKKEAHKIAIENKAADNKFAIENKVEDNKFTIDKKNVNTDRYGLSLTFFVIVTGSAGGIFIYNGAPLIGGGILSVMLGLGILPLLRRLIRNTG